MPPQRPQLLIMGCLVVVTSSAIFAVAAQNWQSADTDAVAARRDEFQSLVGGLGFGPSVDLADCAFSFDPRLQPNCGHLEGPIPGGFFMCPKHVGRVTGYPHLLADQGLDPDESEHATLR